MLGMRVDWENKVFWSEIKTKYGFREKGGTPPPIGVWETLSPDKQFIGKGYLELTWLQWTNIPLTASKLVQEAIAPLHWFFSLAIIFSRPADKELLVCKGMPASCFTWLCNHHPCFGKQGWCSGESSCLSPMWPGFDSTPARDPYVSWVFFLVLTLLWGFSPGTPKNAPFHSRASTQTS